MAAMRKYSGLPDLDPSPEIYETPELTDDSSTHPTSTTLRSESPESSIHEDENTGIDRRRLDADEARTHFLPPDHRNPIFSNRISSKRKSYRASSRRRRKEAPDINGVLNGIDVSSDDEEEHLERKLARLRREVEEIRGEFERQKENSTATNKAIEQRTESIDALSQVLKSVDPTDLQRDKGAASRLTKRFASVSRPNEGLTGRRAAESAQQDGASSTYTVTYAPNYHEDHALSKVSEFDSRLAFIESALGINAILLPTQSTSAAKAILPTLDTLDKQLHTITHSTDSSLDNISRRVRQLTTDAENLERARKSAKAAQEALDLSSNDPGSSLPNTEAASFEVDDYESIAKINALYGTLSTIESLAPLLPSVLDRLRSLRTLHSDAAIASQTLAKVETRQEAMREELQGWREGLEKVEKAMELGEGTMKENTEMVEGWVMELEERMARLG